MNLLKPKKAKLEVLGIEVPIGLLTFYHDGGCVDSIEEYLKELSKKYRVDYERFNINREDLGS